MKYLSFLLLFISSYSFALEPVSGIWNAISTTQKRTGFAVESQNNFVTIYIYSYQNSATTDPTWYIASGDLTQSSDGETASATLSIYTVTNNQLPLAQGNESAGQVDVNFLSPTEATLTWRDFPATVDAQTNIKKFFMVGASSDSEGFRHAALGSWQYSVMMDLEKRQTESFIANYFNPYISETSNIYANVDDSILIGTTQGTNYTAQALFSDDGSQLAVIIIDGSYVWIRLEGGSEYGVGRAAITSGSTPSDSDYIYFATGVRINAISRDNQTIISK